MLDFKNSYWASLKALRSIVYHVLFLQVPSDSFCFIFVTAITWIMVYIVFWLLMTYWTIKGHKIFILLFNFTFRSRVGRLRSAEYFYFGVSAWSAFCLKFSEISIVTLLRSLRGLHHIMSFTVVQGLHPIVLYCGTRSAPYKVLNCGTMSTHIKSLTGTRSASHKVLYCGTRSTRLWSPLLQYKVCTLWSPLLQYKVCTQIKSFTVVQGEGLHHEEVLYFDTNFISQCYPFCYKVWIPRTALWCKGKIISFIFLHGQCWMEFSKKIFSSKGLWLCCYSWRL